MTMAVDIAVALVGAVLLATDFYPTIAGALVVDRLLQTEPGSGDLSPDVGRQGCRS